MPNNIQLVKLVIILLFVSFSALSYIYRKFKEQQQIQAAKTEAARRREEMLRTGRVEASEYIAPTVLVSPSLQPAPPQPQPVTIHDEARRRLQELAAQRRRELEAMARRAAGKPASGAPQPQLVVPPVARPIPTRSSPPLRPGQQQRPRPQPISDQAKRQAQQAAKSAAAREDRAEHERTVSARAEREKQYQSSQIAEQDAARYAESTHSTAITPATAMRAHAAGVPTGINTPTDWRRAIVMMELLAPPVSMRDADAPRAF